MSEIYRLPFHTDNTVENVTQYPYGLFRAGENWYAKVWRGTVPQYEPIERPVRLSDALQHGVLRKVDPNDQSTQEKLSYDPETKLWVPAD